MVAGRLTRVPPFERGLTLGDFLVPIRLGERASSRQRHVLMIAATVAFITLSAQLSFFPPTTPVPIAQTFAVLFTSALLGFRRALIAIVLYLALGVIGLPLFAGWSGGLSHIVYFVNGAPRPGVEGGYLLGFLVAGGLVGRLAELGWDRSIVGAIAAMFVGNVAIYLIGVPWLMAATNIAVNEAVEVGLYPYVIGDAVKLVLAALLLPAGWWLVKRRSTDL